MFVNKVKETEAELKEKEREVSTLCYAAHRLLMLVTLSKIHICDSHLLHFSLITQTCTLFCMEVYLFRVTHKAVTSLLSLLFRVFKTSHLFFLCIARCGEVLLACPP